MANEVIPSGVGDLTAGEQLANEYLYLLSEKDGSVLNHPALMKASVQVRQSNVVRVPVVGLGGYNSHTARTPASEVANTALSDASIDVTIAPYSLVYGIDDLAAYMAQGVLSPMAFAENAAISSARLLINLVANVADGFTATEGSGDLTWDVIGDAITALDVGKAGGPAVCLLHPYQWGDLARDARGAGVAIAPALQGSMNAMLGQSYKGSYLGVDFFTSSEVPLDTGNYKGSIFTKGGIVWADAQYPTSFAPNAISAGNRLFEFERKGSFALTKVISHINLGVALGIDAAGVTLISSST